MTTDCKQIWEQGFDNGYSIAENVFHNSDLELGDPIPRDRDWVGYEYLTEENWLDFYVDITLEIEQSHFRQYSPFEITAKQFNDMAVIKPYNPWEIYEKGVWEGAIAALKGKEIS